MRRLAAQWEILLQAESTAQLRVLDALAILALLLAGVGIHGLLAFTVAQRSREIGVRISLGAEPSLVARTIVGEAARMAIIGLVPAFSAHTRPHGV